MGVIYDNKQTAHTNIQPTGVLHFVDSSWLALTPLDIQNISLILFSALFWLPCNICVVLSNTKYYK